MTFHLPIYSRCPCGRFFCAVCTGGICPNCGEPLTMPLLAKIGDIAERDIAEKEGEQTREVPE